MATFLLEPSLALVVVSLAVWILLSGLDDLLLDLSWVWGRVRKQGDSEIGRAAAAGDSELAAAPESRIAIFVPLWREHRVITAMLEHNIAAIRYRNYEFFVGAYPNDQLTVQEVRKVASRFNRVHLGLCPHDGPTSKADCLNWIYEHMRLYEEERGIRFELIVLHDAEDVIHPDSLRWVNLLGDSYDMIQLPVLSVTADLRSLTLGLYCDEFAESQSKDMVARQQHGSFLPSSGVGAAYTRAALERVAESGSGAIFDPASVTEDYDLGLRLHRLGLRPFFLPLRFTSRGPVATREIFPHDFRRAVRQRGRWVAGICLQAWQKHGWQGSLLDRYWFWRDRKGLVGNGVSMVVNILFLAGFATWLWSKTTGEPWLLGRTYADAGGGYLLTATLSLQCLRLGIRAAFAARIYGVGFAAAVPFRALWGNWINFFATVQALRQYFASRRRRQPLAWVKTDHVYPSRATLISHRRRIGEILVGCGWLSEEELTTALSSEHEGVRLGTLLMSAGAVSEYHFYQALSLQQNVPFEQLDPRRLSAPVVRALPAAFVEKWRVLPFRVESGHLCLAGPDLPAEEMRGELRNYTRLKVRFYFITPSNLEALRKEFIC